MTTIDYKYVFGTFEDCDVEDRLGDDEAYEGLLAYIKEHGLMDEIIMYAVDEMREWVYWAAGDAMWDALDIAVRKVTGRNVSDWREESYESEEG